MGMEGELVERWFEAGVPRHLPYKEGRLGAGHEPFSWGFLLVPSPPILFLVSFFFCSCVETQRMITLPRPSRNNSLRNQVLI